MGIFGISKVIVIIALLSGLLSGGYIWHKKEVELQLTKSVQELNLKHATEITKLTTKSSKVSLNLQQKAAENEQQKQQELVAIADKYNSLLSWVSAQPKYTTSTSNISRSPGTEEDRQQDVIGELRRRHAVDLAGYAKQTETLKHEVITCYKQYDAVKEALDKFRVDNQPRTSLKP